jgi:anti-sigma B factor antagonist
MAFGITVMEGTTVVTLPRRFDTDSAPAAEKELEPVIGRHPERILFDFSATDYISSAGMRVLVKTLRAMKKTGGTVAFSSLNSQVGYIFEIAGFLKLFAIYKTRKKALKHLSKKD